MYLSPFNIETLPSLEPGNENVTALGVLQTAMDQGLIPAGFPTNLWILQSFRYKENWAWYRGDHLEELYGYDKDGRPVYRYPLKMNPIRNFARKHASLVLGDISDGGTIPVRSMVKPKLAWWGEEPPDNTKGIAKKTQFFLQEVWANSNPRSMLYENALVSQILGGHVFRVNYVPWRSDLSIPITVRGVLPDFFLPLWSSDNPWDLLEAYIVYRIPRATAEREWPGMKMESYSPTYVTYVEHWDKEKYSITIDGKPLETRYTNAKTGSSIRVKYKDEENPFGFVPMVYIPRLREGSNYGSPLVPDIKGLQVEFNSRMADVGDAVRKAIHRRRIGRNISREPESRDLDKNSGSGEKYLDIGATNPAYEDKPELWAEDPPDWHNEVIAYNEFLWDQLNREGNLGPTAFGEDEGSQRSALTLAFRMWPATIIGKSQRMFWTDGLNAVDRLILRMANVHNVKVNGFSIPDDVLMQYDIEKDWDPMIPRDREAEVSEIIARLSGDTPSISLETALEKFGDIPDVKEEVAKIQEMLDKKQENAMSLKSASPAGDAFKGAPPSGGLEGGK